MVFLVYLAALVELPVGRVLLLEIDFAASSLLCAEPVSLLGQL